MPQIKILTSSLLNEGTGSPAGSPLVETGPGTAFRMSYVNKLFQVTIDGTATIDIQGSQDNLNWTTLSTENTSGKYENKEVWKYVRGNITAWTSGAVILTVAQAAEMGL